MAQEVSPDLLNRLNSAESPIICRIPWPRDEREHDNGGVNVLYSAAPMENAKQNLIPVESSERFRRDDRFRQRQGALRLRPPVSPRPATKVCGTVVSTRSPNC